MEDVAALFAQRGDVGANGAEGLGPGDGTETPGGFLLELGHADIAFGLVVVEGHPRVGEETQDIVGVLTQAQEKIERRGLLDPATPSVGPCAGRIVAFAVVCTPYTVHTSAPLREHGSIQMYGNIH